MWFVSNLVIRHSRRLMLNIWHSVPKATGASILLPNFKLRTASQHRWGPINTNFTLVFNFKALFLKRHLYSSSAQLCAQTLVSFHYIEHTWHKGKAEVDCRHLWSSVVAVCRFASEDWGTNFFKTSEIYQLTRRNIPEDLNLNKQTARATFALSLHFRFCDKILYDMLKPFPNCVVW